MVLKESCLDLVLKQGFKQGQVHLYCSLLARGDGLFAGAKRAINQKQKGK